MPSSEVANNATFEAALDQRGSMKGDFKGQRGIPVRRRARVQAETPDPKDGRLRLQESNLPRVDQSRALSRHAPATGRVLQDPPERLSVLRASRPALGEPRPRRLRTRGLLRRTHAATRGEASSSFRHRSRWRISLGGKPVGDLDQARSHVGRGLSPTVRAALLSVERLPKGRHAGMSQLADFWASTTFLSLLWKRSEGD